MIARRRARRSEEVNMAPLIDMMFILLIFFLVTARFTKDTGIQIERPLAASAKTLEGSSVLVVVDRNDQIYVDDHPVEIASLRGMIRRALRDAPGVRVLVVSDAGARAGTLVRVYDECRLSGAKNVAVATRE